MISFYTMYFIYIKRKVDKEFLSISLSNQYCLNNYFCGILLVHTQNSTEFQQGFMRSSVKEVSRAY